MKQIHSAVVFLKLPYHAPDKPLPVSLLPVSPSRRNSSVRNPSLIFSRRRALGVVGNEKEWRDLLRLHPDFEGRTRSRYPGQHFPLLVPACFRIGKSLSWLRLLSEFLSAFFNVGLFGSHDLQHRSCLYPQQKRNLLSGHPVPQPAYREFPSVLKLYQPQNRYHSREIAGQRIARVSE